MKTAMYSLYDTAVCAYSFPFQAGSDNHARRIIRETLLFKDTLFSKYPEHYNLFRLGSFDSESGQIVSQPPKHVCSISCKGEQDENCDVFFI